MEKEEQRKQAIERLHEKIKRQEASEEELWQSILLFQGASFFTCSGLPFTYVVKRGKKGAYTGELLITRKEESKTLTKSSILYAYRKVLGEMEVVGEREEQRILRPKFYKGPKAIGQIFGISYIYSMFLRFGLICR